MLPPADRNWELILAEAKKFHFFFDDKVGNYNEGVFPPIFWKKDCVTRVACSCRF
jgi:hypothetical protein